MHLNPYGALLYLTSSVKGHLSTPALCVICAPHSLKIMRTYLKVIAQRIFGDGVWKELNGNIVISVSISPYIFFFKEVI